MLDISGYSKIPPNENRWECRKVCGLFWIFNLIWCVIRYARAFWSVQNRNNIILLSLTTDTIAYYVCYCTYILYYRQQHYCSVRIPFRIYEPSVWTLEPRAHVRCSTLQFYCFYSVVFAVTFLFSIKTQFSTRGS